jgi:hypothetical protein
MTSGPRPAHHEWLLSIPASLWPAVSPDQEGEDGGCAMYEVVTETELSLEQGKRQ